MSHIYAAAVLQRMLPLLQKGKYTEVPAESLATALGIPTQWVVQAIDDLVRNDYLTEVMKTEQGHPCYCPHHEHPELAGLL